MIQGVVEVLGGDAVVEFKDHTEAKKREEQHGRTIE
jgi:hypothetical protein